MTAAQRKKLIYGAIIGAGLLVLLIDRLFLGGATAPGEAVAADGAPTEVAGQPGQPASLAGGIPVLPFPRNLPPFNPQADSERDVFASPLERQALQASSASAGADGEGSADAPGVKEFVARHRLDGTIVGSRQKLAFVDGARLQIGAKVDGFTLVEIVSQGAVFRRDGELATLRTADPISRKADAPTQAPGQ
ncbi:MAG: hypothetical protein IT449_08345 [Phycisphaerales bacterium]|nr:hypothetical protein [Phycisphaerales bacterium]